MGGPVAEGRVVRRQLGDVAMTRVVTSFAHRHAQTRLLGRRFGDVVAGVDVSKHAHRRVVGQHAGQLLAGEGGAVGDADLSGVDGATDADALRRGEWRPRWRPRPC
jgi:hypothetical protein